MSRLVLGINSAHADASAVLAGPDGPIAAIAEERLNRKKHCAGFPTLAVQEVLRVGGATLRDVTDIAVARDAKANISAKVEFLARHPRAGVPLALRRLRVHQAVAQSPAYVAHALGALESDVRATFHSVEHHRAHVASAFFWSAFERATGLSVDGAGDFASSMIAKCEGNRIQVLRRNYWPHSLGVFYTAICQFLGFDKFGEEYKLMGLAAYGVNRFAREIRQLVHFDSRRGIRLNLSYFRHQHASAGLQIPDESEATIPPLWSPRLINLLGEPRRRGDALDDRHRDIAASLQARFEEIYLELVDSAVHLCGSRNGAFAGGSVLNSVGNGRVITEGVVERAYYHPAASDDGTAMGAALHVLHEIYGSPRNGGVKHAYWGTPWDDGKIERAIQASGFPVRRLSRSNLIDIAGTALSEGKIVGWFQGREEWGPRALGNRSILCHPGWPDMKAILNARIKNREPFRPFAPAVLEHELNTCFQGTHEVPFMIIVYRVRPEWKTRLSAVTHEDGTGRVQTVRREQNEIYFDLISNFQRKTGIPVLLNTSFNENEPIVHTPEQAIDCFARTRMNALGIGPFWLEKEL